MPHLVVGGVLRKPRATALYGLLASFPADQDHLHKSASSLFLMRCRHQSRQLSLQLAQTSRLRLVPRLSLR